jgi:multidrug efflux pump subunit AcrA (membrane-fusion protein)
MNRIEQKIFRQHRREIILGASLAALAMLFAGCGKKAASPPPPEVGVVTVATEPLPVTTELPDRIDAVRTAAAGTSSRLRHKTPIFGQLEEYLCKIIPEDYRSNFRAA